MVKRRTYTAKTMQHAYDVARGQAGHDRATGSWQNTLHTAYKRSYGAGRIIAERNSAAYATGAAAVDNLKDGIK
tara:strand:+ start:29716 stop:29937 length:222 start_codon:yes stop_codon:yes gene_type:complete